MAHNTKPMKEKAVKSSFGKRYIVGRNKKNGSPLEFISGPRVGKP
jgi:hypothetical protein